MSFDRELSALTNKFHDECISPAELARLQSLRDEDRFLTLLATDGDGRNDFDHTVLIDPVLELATKK